MYNLLRSKNEGARDQMVAFAQDLVRTPSPSLGESDVAGLVEEQMRAMGFDEVVQDDAGNVIGVLFGRDGSHTVLLNSHMDTVAAGDGSAWSEPPHSGSIRDGRLYGVGSGDCKGGLAAQVFAAGLLKRSLLPLLGNVVVAATVAEEYGRSAGVRRLLDATLPSMLLKPTYAILGEPTRLGLYYGHDGWAEINVQVEGANPFLVDDAATAVFREFDARRAEGRLAAHCPRFEDLGRGRCATIQLDRRLSPTETVAEALEESRRDASLMVSAAGAVAVRAEVRRETQTFYTGRATAVRHVTHAWSTDPFHPLMERARHALDAAGCEVRPGKWELGRLGMGTAGGVMVKEFGLPAIGYGPGQEERVHSPNELVEIDDIVEAAYGTAAIVHSLVGAPVFGWTSEDV